MEMIETAWFLHDLVRCGHGILGVRAPVVIEYSKNLIAHPEVLDLRFLHDSRNVAPENCRKLRPKTIGSRPNLAIDRIDPGRVHTDQDLIACRFGRRRLLIAKHRRPAKLMYSGRLHSMTLLPFRAAAIRNGSAGRGLSKSDVGFPHPGRLQQSLSSGNVELVFVPEPQHQQRAKNRHDYPGWMT